MPWLDTILIAAILVVDWLLWRDQRRALSLYEDFFKQRANWYASRSKPRARKAAPEANEDASLLVRSEIQRQDDGERAPLRPTGADVRTPELEVVSEALLEESQEREDGEL